jgi:hypothetical protein
MINGTKKCADCKGANATAQIRTVGVGFEYLCEKCYERWHATRYPRSASAQKYWAKQGK